MFFATISSTPEPWYGNPLVSVIIGILGLVIAILFGVLPLRKRDKKELAYRYISKVPLVNFDKSTNSYTELHIDGKVVEDATMLVLEISSTGNMPVSKEDYDSPITFDFKQGTVIKANALQVENSLLLDPQLSLVTSPKKIELPPLLFNSGEKLTIQVLVEGQRIACIGKARIIGVKFKEDTSSSQLTVHMGDKVVLSIILGILMDLIIVQPLISSYSNIALVVIVLMIFVGILLLVSITVTAKKAGHISSGDVVT